MRISCQTCGKTMILILRMHKEYLQPDNISVALCEACTKFLEDVSERERLEKKEMEWKTTKEKQQQQQQQQQDDNDGGRARMKEFPGRVSLISLDPSVWCYKCERPAEQCICESGEMSSTDKDKEEDPDDAEHCGAPCCCHSKEEGRSKETKW